MLSEIVIGKYSGISQKKNSRNIEKITTKMRKGYIMEIKRSILDICKIHDNFLLLQPVQLNHADIVKIRKA